MLGVCVCVGVCVSVFVCVCVSVCVFMCVLNERLSWWRCVDDVCFLLFLMCRKSVQLNTSCVCVFLLFILCDLCVCV